MGKVSKAAQRTALMERRANVGELHLMGVSYREIGRQLNVSRTTIMKDVRAIRADWQATATGLMATATAAELRKLSKIEKTCWTSMRTATVKEKGVLIAQILKSMDRRAELLGLDKPAEAKVELTGLGNAEAARQSILADPASAELVAQLDERIAARLN